MMATATELLSPPYIYLCYTGSSFSKSTPKRKPLRNVIIIMGNFLNFTIMTSGWMAFTIALINSLLR